jgi:hypothetical protein
MIKPPILDTLYHHFIALPWPIISRITARCLRIDVISINIKDAHTKLIKAIPINPTDLDDIYIVLWDVPNKISKFEKGFQAYFKNIP